jgi:hypothetical protein
VTLVEAAPAVVTLLYDHEIINILQKRLSDYLTSTGNTFNGPASLTPILRLAMAMLPEPDAVIRKATARTVAPRAGGRKRTVEPPPSPGKQKATGLKTPQSSTTIIPVAVAKEVTPKSEKWSCPTCTFINHNSTAMACEMCGTLNFAKSPSLSGQSPMLAGAYGQMIPDLTLGGGIGEVPTSLDFSSFSGPMTILEVYMENPDYYATYARVRISRFLV